MSSETAHDKLVQAPDRLADRKIGAVTAGGIAVMAIALVVAWALFETWTPARVHEGGTAAPAPRTISTLEQSLVLHTERGLDLREQQKASLARFGWVDRDAGVARIPVEKAIDLLASSPLPADTSVEDRIFHDAGSEARP